MPLTYSANFKSGVSLATWHIAESESFFLERLSMTPFDERELSIIQVPEKRLQWLASRYLLKRLINHPETLFLNKDEFGKPFLENVEMEFSMAHSHNMVACIISKEHKVGIDLEKIDSKVDRVKHKFLTPQEIEKLDPNRSLEQLTVYWSAKETLYKIHGRKKLAFMNDIIIDSFMPSNSGTLTGRTKNTYSINYIRLNEFYLTYAAEDLALQINGLTPV